MKQLKKESEWTGVKGPEKGSQRKWKAMKAMKSSRKKVNDNSTAQDRTEQQLTRYKQME